MSPNVITRTLRPDTKKGWSTWQGLSLPEPALLALYDLTHQVSPKPVQPDRVTTFPCCLFGDRWCEQRPILGGWGGKYERRGRYGL